MIRVTATMLEAFRRFKESEYVTYDDLVVTLRGQVEPNIAMQVGTAVHKLMETTVVQDHIPDSAVYQCVKQDGFTFALDSVIRAASWVDSEHLREVEGDKLYIIDSEPVYLRCRADVVYGSMVADYKVTMSAINDSKLQSYEDSMQWKAYLAVFAAQYFIFNVQRWDVVEGLYTYLGSEYVHCDRYVGLEGDVQRAVVELYQFCKEHNLLDALTKEEQPWFI